MLLNNSFHTTTLNQVHVIDTGLTSSMLKTSYATIAGHIKASCDAQGHNVITH